MFGAWTRIKRVSASVGAVAPDPCVWATTTLPTVGSLCVGHPVENWGCFFSIKKKFKKMDAFRRVASRGALATDTPISGDGGPAPWPRTGSPPPRGAAPPPRAEAPPVWPSRGAGIPPPAEAPPAPPRSGARLGGAGRGGAGGERAELAALAGWEAALGAPRSAERPGGSEGSGRRARSRAGRSSTERSGRPPGDYRLARLFGRGRRKWDRAAGSPRWNSPERGCGEPWTAGGTVLRREPALSPERTGMTF